MAVGRINEMARLTGFSHKKTFWVFCRNKKSGHNKEVTGKGASTVTNSRVSHFVCFLLLL